MSQHSAGYCCRAFYQGQGWSVKRHEQILALISEPLSSSYWESEREWITCHTVQWFQMQVHESPTVIFLGKHCINPLNLHRSPKKEVLLLFPCYRWGNRSSEWQSDLPHSHFPALWPWVNCLTSLGFSFLQVTWR